VAARAGSRVRTEMARYLSALARLEGVQRSGRRVPR